MYSFNSRIRYSEVDEDKNLTVGGIINYFQDCSSFQSEDIGVGFDFLESNHRAWVLNAWQIVLEKYPKYGERITIGTWPYDFRGFIGYRNFVLLNEEKEKLAYANSIWSYLDTQTGRFARRGNMSSPVTGLRKGWTWNMPTVRSESRREEKMRKAS